MPRKIRTRVKRSDLDEWRNLVEKETLIKGEPSNWYSRCTDDLRNQLKRERERVLPVDVGNTSERERERGAWWSESSDEESVYPCNGWSGQRSVNERRISEEKQIQIVEIRSHYVGRNVLEDCTGVHLGVEIFLGILMAQLNNSLHDWILKEHRNLLFSWTRSTVSWRTK